MSTAWSRFVDQVVRVPSLDFVLDFSTMSRETERRAPLADALPRALEQMQALEGGAIANPDENRQVGHYWLRAAQRAPGAEWTAAIESMNASVRAFGEKVRSGQIVNEKGEAFDRLLQIGIGGSALGPQLAADCLSSADDPLQFAVLDNTDPAGIERAAGGDLSATLVVVVSKSGGTPETRNGMVEVVARLAAQGLNPARHLVAVTGEGSKLDRRAEQEGWLARFPIWDWVGGRTSQMSAVGLLPMAILGHDIGGLLEGARLMDEATRSEDVAHNPALRLAECWHVASDGRGARDMVVIPYKDSLQMMARYLQQLVMESLGKRLDLDGKRVDQGLAVYGNKGSTDQHAYVQQLRDGVDNFFATLIGVDEDGGPQPAVEVEPGIESGDYLTGFLLGTRQALIERGRHVITIRVPRADARTLGGLIALYERAVGFYASLVRINAYHQPGVEAGKKAAANVLTLQAALISSMQQSPGEFASADVWAERAGFPELAVESWWILERFAGRQRAGVSRAGETADPQATYGCSG